MVPFKAAKKDEFQANKHPHHEYSFFDSGARQRIVKYLIENDIDGIDLAESVHAKASVQRKGFLESVASAGVEAVEQAAKTTASGAMTIANTAAAQASKASTVVGADKVLATVKNSVHDGVHAMHELHVVEDAIHAVGAGLDIHSPVASVQGIKKTLVRQSTFFTSYSEAKAIEQHHTGSMRLWPCINDYFPLSDKHEVEFLTSMWADPKLIIRGVRTQKVASVANANFGTITTQPIEEIRDYFGEQIGLYFAFLRVYTDSLVFPTVIGALTMLGHLRNGVEGNPLSVAYSILVSFWSVAFISKWHRRQAELCFLWGTSTYEENETTRKQFRLKEHELKFEIDEFTGKEEPVPKNPFKIYYRSAVSILVGAFFIAAVVIAALAAEYVTNLSQPGQLGKYAKVVGSSLNACAILILSKVYEVVARVLTEWENHRVQTSFENSLIL